MCIIGYICVLYAVHGMLHVSYQECGSTTASTVGVHVNYRMYMCLIYLTYYAPYIISISYQDVTQYGSTTASTSRAYVWYTTYKRHMCGVRHISVSVWHTVHSLLNRSYIISGAPIVSTTAGTSRVPVSNTTYKPQSIICRTDSVYMSLIWHSVNRPRMDKSHSKRHELVDCPLFTIAR